MKKRFLAALTGCIVAISGISAFAAAKTIVLDGTAAEIPADMGSIKEMDDRTFVPVRFVSEKLGCTVKYNAIKMNDTLQENVTITDKNNVSYLMIKGENKLYIIPASGNGSVIEMDTAVFIDEAEGRTYIPIRFLAQALGYEVGWDEAAETVSLTAK